MKAEVKNKVNSKIVAVILADGSIVFENSVPLLHDRQYPCVILRDKVSITTGDLEYWARGPKNTPVYEGQSVTLQF